MNQVYNDLLESNTMANKWIDIEIDGISGQYRLECVKDFYKVQKYRVIAKYLNSSCTTIIDSGIIDDKEQFDEVLKDVLMTAVEIEEGLWD